MKTWIEVIFSLCLCVQGLIFVVDSNDPERIKEAADELHKMVKSSSAIQHSFYHLDMHTCAICCSKRPATPAVVPIVL